MNAYMLLDALRRQGASVEVDGDALRLKAPRGALSADLLDALKRHKKEIIAILSDAAKGGDAILPRGADEAPLSFAQRQLWFLDQLSPGNPFYNNPAAIRLTGALQRAALSQALEQVIRRHGALRTVFRRGEDGEPVQRVGAPTPFELPLTDLSALPAEQGEAAARQAMEEDALAPFDLSTGPLIRTRLLRLAPDEHLWLLNVHHIVADGWSIGILIDEVTQCYAAAIEGRAPTLAPLAVQYADYASWQRRQLRGETLDAQLDYWKRQLDGAPALLSLPTDRPRPAVQRFQGDNLSAMADVEVLRGLQALGQQAQCTLFSTLMAAFAVLLWRYSGQDDLCIGTPFANRTRGEVEPLIGHFINPLVIRHRLDPAQPFRDLLRTVRGQVLEAYAHQDLPFDQLVEALRPSRHTSYSPLFQVMLVMQNMPRGRLELPGLALQPLRTGTASAKFDLSLEAVEEQDGLRLDVEYDTDLFDRATIARLTAHFVHLLGRIVARPDLPIDQLPLLGEQESRRQLQTWNATTRPLAGPPQLAARFAEQVRRDPRCAAVVGEDGRLSYGELDRRANRLAQALIARGVQCEDRVGICLPRSTDLVVGLLAVLKAGAAYLPLDPSLPAERLAFLLENAAPRLVLSDRAERIAGGLPLAAVEAEGHSDLAPEVELSGEHLAYVIYTSGSSGRPKGVAVSHRGIASLFDHWQRRLGALPGEAAALWSSIGFDVSIQELLLPLTTGGTLHLVPEDLRTDPVRLLDWMRQHCIAQGYLPPAFVRWIAEAPAERLAGLSLRQLLVGVEPLQERDLYRMQQALPGLAILNGYGPTETSVYSTAYFPIQDIDRQCPIGKPLDNTRLYLLDGALNPVPIGVAGELYIGGVGLARGYLDEPALTAAAFLPDPHSPEPGARMYRTGDLARYLPDGNLEYLGRRDDQVKVRGYRVEPGEIEAALRAEAGVREAAVLVVKDDGGDARLLAGVTLQDGTPPRGSADWRALLAQRLPSHMVPAAVVELPALPQTPNGKLDREALLALARGAGSRQVNLASPRDHIELALYQAWKGLLLQPQIGIRDNFFEIGGTSISAIKLAHAIEARFGVSLPIRDILLHPTIEALGGRLRQGASATAASNLIAFRPGDGSQRLVCIHPAGGTAFCYLSLAKAMPERCGVYGIQSPGVNPGEDFLPTVEAMADAYLRLVEPLGDGPLILTGLSYGGLVAYEMACRLARAGHRQVSVVLLDTHGLEDPAHRAAVSPVDMASFRDKLVKFNGMYPGIDDRQVEQYFRIYNHNRLTMRDYVAPPCPLRVVLVQAMGGRDRPFLREARGYWQRRVRGGFLVKLVHGDHWEMLETDEVRRVSALLRRELATLSDATATAEPRRDAALPVA